MQTTKQVKILIIDDEKAICDILSASLTDDGYVVTMANDGMSGLEAIAKDRPHIVLLDIWMPGEMDGIDVLKKAKDQFPNIQFIVMSGHGTIETAVKATKLGAWDFVEKPLSMDKISILISNIMSYQKEMNEKNNLLNRLRRNIAIIGQSESVVKLKRLISRVAPTQSWVLITGENGTGKELVAQNIHYLSSRASKPFVEVNCAAIPSDLIESELFGYEKGAFTGAEQSKLGKFDLAHGGTLFLDEIGDMRLEAQAKILRILQEKRFQRVGGIKNIEVDVRIVAATNKDLTEEINSGRFREDLYYRLNVVPFHVPALKERKVDVPALIIHFSNHFSKEGGYLKKQFTDKAFDFLKDYAWPGNVRELKNFIERLYILIPGEIIDVADVQMAGLNYQDNKSEPYDIYNLTFREARSRFEKDFILKMIEENNGNISKTAENIRLGTKLFASKNQVLWVRFIS